MSVKNCHESYLFHKLQWDRISDVLDGSDSVKTSAKEYLPMLEGHLEDPSSYERYVNGALFMNATSRCVDAYQGAIFRKDPTVTVPARLKPRLDNVNGSGDSFYTFAKRVTRHNISFGRYGLLVEAPAPRRQGEPDPVDPRDPAGTLPWIAGYEARDIRCWRTKTMGGKRVVDQIILHERTEVPGDTEFGFQYESRYRVLDLDEGGYRIRLFTESDTGDSVQIGEDILPTVNGKRLSYIPFIFVGPTDLQPDVTRSPILDLVDVNLSHFRSSAELEVGRGRLAFPLAIIIGADTDPIPLKFGGDHALWLPAGADAKFLEFSGKGLDELAAALPQKEGYMATLGARLLQEPKREAEAAETHYIKQSSENSTLASVAKTTSDALKQALTWMAEWVSAVGEVKCELNTDFFDVPISPQAVTSLIAAVQGGLMPVDDFLWVLKQGELLRPDLTIEEARALIEQDAPRLMGTPENLSDTPQQGQQQPQQRAGNSSTPNVPDSRQPPSGTPRKASA